MEKTFDVEKVVIINLDNVSSLEAAKDLVINTIKYFKNFRIGTKILKEREFECKEIKEIIDFVNENGGNVFYDFPEIKEDIAKTHFSLISTWNLGMVTIPSNFNSEIIRGIKSILKDSFFVGYPVFSTREQYDYKATELRLFMERFVTAGFHGIVLSSVDVFSASNLMKDLKLKFIDKNVYNPIEDREKTRINKKIFRSISAGASQIIIDLPNNVDPTNIPFVFNYLENEIDYAFKQINTH